MTSSSPFRPLALSAVLGVTVLIAAASVRAQSPSVVDDLPGFSPADRLELHAGSAVIRSLDTPVREEIAYLGVVYFDAPTALFVERFRDIERFESGPGIPQIGRFSAFPRIEDLESLELPAADIEALQECRPGDCDLKLSTAAMERFRKETDWTSPNVDLQANEVVREMILDLVLEYQAGGNAALGHYDDKDESLYVAEQFRALLGSGDSLPVPIPEILAYLEDYPHGRPAGAEDFFYWSVIDFGLKPTIRVNHVTIVPLGPDPPSGVEYVIAIKQLYASHYFHTALELRFLVDESSSERENNSLISITRSRNDGMTGFGGLFRRPIIHRRSRDAIRGYLENIKRQIESPVPSAPCLVGDVPGCRGD